MKFRFLYLIVLYLLLLPEVLAQDISPQYVKSGKIYHAPPRVSHSTAYFKDMTFTPGTIVFDKVKYENLSLIYDVSSDKLVIDDGTYIHVVKKLVNYFTVKEDTIIYMSNTAGGIPDGYYEKIYRSDKSSGVAKHSKYLKEVMRGTVMERGYEETIRYYVLLPGLNDYKDVKSEKDLLNIRKDLKKEARVLLRSRSLTFKKNPGETIKTLLPFYETRL